MSFPEWYEAERSCHGCKHAIKSKDTCGPMMDNMYCNVKDDMDLSNWNWHSNRKVEERGCCKDNYEPRTVSFLTTIYREDSLRGMDVTERYKMDTEWAKKDKEAHYDGRHKRTEAILLICGTISSLYWMATW